MTVFEISTISVTMVLFVGLLGVLFSFGIISRADKTNG